MSNEHEDTELFTVLVKFPGEKKSYRLAPGGKVTRLRMHASPIKGKENAEAWAKDIQENNPGVSAKVAKF